MAGFPTFGTANRDAPLFQKEIFPNIEFETSVSRPPSSPRIVIVKISIVNLKTSLVAPTIDRVFAYALASASNEMLTSSIEIPASVDANIHFAIDISKATSLGFSVPTTPGGLSTQTSTVVRTANIDILIENLQIQLLDSTLQRVKDYMTNAVSSDLNP